jgi:hypothetical protein
MARSCCSAQEIRDLFVALRHDRRGPRAYSAGMVQADLAGLARRYLDLWERHLAASAGVEPGLAAADAAKIMVQALADANLQGKGVAKNGLGSKPNAANAPPAPGPASIDGDDLHDEFARRLARCAEQFAALAAGTATNGGGADG